jgi:rubrerythrin
MTMPLPLPQGAPSTLSEAFGFINTVTAPTINDLKVMVLVEAAGKTLYEHMAASLSDTRVQALLLHNGREELAHAHRVSKAITAMTGESYPPPAAAENPYLQGGSMPPMEVTVDALTKLSEAEFGGDALYERWASNTKNAEAAELMRQNGREESQHGNRLLEAARLLVA